MPRTLPRLGSRSLPSPALRQNQPGNGSLLPKWRPALLQGCSHVAGAEHSSVGGGHTPRGLLPAVGGHTPWHHPRHPRSSTQTIARPMTTLLSFRISNSFKRPAIFLGKLLLVIKRCSFNIKIVFSHIHSRQVLLTWSTGDLARLAMPMWLYFYFRLLYEDCVLPINPYIFRF